MGRTPRSANTDAKKVLLDSADSTNKKEGLAGLVANALNKKFKDVDQIAYFLDSGEISPTDVPGWISSGATLLDLIVSNDVDRGLPLGKTVELQGLSSAGKSLIGAHVLASAQRIGGVAVYIDTENAVSSDFLEVIGVDLSQLIYISLPPEKNTVEDIYEIVEDVITTVREKSPDVPMVILVDSLAAASTRAEVEADFGKEGWATQKALINAKAFRKLGPVFARNKVLFVVTNQLKHKLDVSWGGDNYTTTGGLAVGYHSDVRIRLTQAGTMKDKDGLVVGNYIRAKTTKNRLAPPYKEISFPLYYDSGIDDVGSLFYWAKDHGLLANKKGSSWYTIEADFLPEIEDKDSGKMIRAIRFQAKDWHEVMSNTPGLRAHVIGLIKDKLATIYKKRTADDLKDVSITEEVQAE